MVGSARAPERRDPSKTIEGTIGTASQTRNKGFKKHLGKGALQQKKVFENVMKILIKFLFWYRSKNRAKRKKRQNRSEQPRFSSVPFQKWVFVGRYLQRRPQIPSCTLPQTDVSPENMPKPKRTFHLPSINFQIKNRYFQVKEVFSKPISILYFVHFLCLLSIWRALLRSQRQDSVSTIKAWHAKTTSVSLSKHLLGGFNPWTKLKLCSSN